MAFDNTLTISAGNVYERLTEGKWVKNDSTPTAPKYWIIKSNPRANGIADYLVRYEHHKDPDVGMGLSPDQAGLMMSVHTVIRVDNRFFTSADVTNGINRNSEFLVSATNLAKLLRGEK